ncbi:NADH-quinone oxidoreductase subunit C [Longispora sp. K20-0274]|uniref:NADH-quinone oxidoreductase subunit C n=1 Tax=Longispora sp. K20-0274 TaxID=3088255 RepID=UPI00399BA2F0
MTAEELAHRLAERVGGEVGVSSGGDWARHVVDVPVDGWVRTLESARGEGLTFFDWLSAVDELDEGFRIVAHLWSVPDRFGLLIRTLTPREAPSVPSATGVFPGAAWHERETHEMFGVDFPGNDNLQPLLLPPEFEGQPLRKEFVLASRVAKPWPGAKEPGEGAEGSSKRAPMRPPGVPTAEEWGPRR